MNIKFFVLMEGRTITVESTITADIDFWISLPSHIFQKFLVSWIKRAFILILWLLTLGFVLSLWIHQSIFLKNHLFSRIKVQNFQSNFLLTCLFSWIFSKIRLVSWSETRFSFHVCSIAIKRLSKWTTIYLKIL